MKTLRWENKTLIVLDQTKLPSEEVYRRCTSWREVREAISVLAVRGAPAIGIAAAYAVVLAAAEIQAGGSEKTTAVIAELEEIAASLAAVRPTAVNLHWALRRMMKTVEAESAAGRTPVQITTALEREAVRIHKDDIAINGRISKFGAEALLEEAGRKRLTLLTHCNAGALATAEIGTALGVVRALHEQNRLERVYADETRPLLQGARLTATELYADGIPVTLITDNMAAWVMKTKKVDAVIVGADRIAANGDTANKIGTYGLSIAAKELGVPFYVAAPTSTFDVSMQRGEEIPIEERNHDEVRQIQGVPVALKDIAVFNPAFDVTPHENIRAIITDRGVIEAPAPESVAKFFTV